MMTPSQTGSTSIMKSTGAVIGTMTKMISKVSRMKPSRNIITMTKMIAPT